ncbi:MAG: SDR family oxidoreductase [Planctomycetota bacterium]|nr:SDR family oxidoreductase [Planctomycetota bacterium]
MSNDVPKVLTGRRAIVTGATRRLGSAIAQRLAAKGVSLYLHYRSDEEGRQKTSEALDALGGTYVWHRADLGDADACKDVVDAAISELGGVDYLVNNAATFKRTPLESMTVEDFDQQMRINARSVYALSMHAGRHMKAEGHGAIVNIVDISATRPWGTHVPYCASKAAVANMTRGFAQALAPEVRVNAVSPGSALPPEDAAQGSGETGAPIAGHSGAEAIAAAVELMLTADYVTGVDLFVDGGRSLV